MSQPPETDLRTRRMPALKAPRLVPGDRVALICPSGRPSTPSVVQRCTKVVEEMGFRPVLGKHVLAVHGPMAGQDSQRLNDLTDALTDDSIRGIFFVSGGWGSLRLVSLLNFDLVLDSPKVMMGYGENTSLLAAINTATGLVVFHGPNIDQITKRYTFNACKTLFQSNSDKYVISSFDSNDEMFSAGSYAPISGVAEGITVGGNLSALSFLSGTVYAPSYKDALLVLDDANEFNGTLERWFTNLHLGGCLRACSAVAFGGFENCGGKGAENSLPFEDTAGDTLRELGKTSLFGLKFGQRADTNVVPIGIPARLDTESATLEFSESPFN